MSGKVGCKGWSVEDYRDCQKAGMTQAETARHLGVSPEAVRQVANRYGLKFKPSGKGWSKRWADA